MIKLENDQVGQFSDWFVERVTISCSSDSREIYEFPCGHWVQKRSVTFENKGKVIYGISIANEWLCILEFAIPIYDAYESCQPP